MCMGTSSTRFWPKREVATRQRSAEIRAPLARRDLTHFGLALPIPFLLQSPIQQLITAFSSLPCTICKGGNVMAPRSFLPHLLAVVGLLWSTLLAPAQQPKDSPPLVPTLPLVPSPTQPQPIPLPPLPPPVFQPLPLRFTFKIDPKAPVKDLLPTPPQAQLPLLYLNEDLR